MRASRTFRGDRDLARDRGPLRYLFIEITDRCHLSCLHCSSVSSPEGRAAIEYGMLVHLFEQSIPLGLRHVCLSGGEPLLYEGLGDLCTWLSQRGVPFSLYTCGVTRGGDGRVAPVARQTLEMVRTASSLIFSLHGSRARVHDALTGTPGSHVCCLKTIESAADMGLEFEIHFVPTRINWRELKPAVTLARALGATRFSILRLVEQGRALHAGLHLSPGESRALIDELFEVTEAFPGFVRLGAPWTCVMRPWGGRCAAGQDKLLISAEGKVFPCEAFKFTSARRSGFWSAPLDAIWREDSLLNELRGLDPAMIEHCRECPELGRCRGGCPGQRLLRTGSLYRGPDPLCMAARGFQEVI